MTTAVPRCLCHLVGRWIDMAWRWTLLGHKCVVFHAGFWHSQTFSYCPLLLFLLLFFFPLSSVLLSFYFFCPFFLVLPSPISPSLFLSYPRLPQHHARQQAFSPPPWLACRPAGGAGSQTFLVTLRASQSTSTNITHLPAAHPSPATRSSPTLYMYATTNTYEVIWGLAIIHPGCASTLQFFIHPVAYPFRVPDIGLLHTW